jgi:hypothetical protein
MEAAGRRYAYAYATGLFLGGQCLAVPGIPGWARRGLKDGGAGGNHRGNPWGARGRVPPLVSPRCPAGLTGRALLLFLTSPPRVLLDGGVRSGTPLSSALCASGQASRATRAQRGCTVSARAVRALCR